MGPDCISDSFAAVALGSYSLVLVWRTYPKETVLAATRSTHPEERSLCLRVILLRFGFKLINFLDDLTGGISWCRYYVLSSAACLIFVFSMVGIAVV